jgi:hypothetical protein
MAITLKRYNSIRRTDDVDDQQGSPAILGALTASATQEELQVFYLSRLRQVIFGETSVEHWYDDFLGDGILSLKDLSAGFGIVRVRVGVPLVGPLDGTNRVFRTTPDYFVHDLAGNGKTIEVWHNGRRLIQTATHNPGVGDYWVEESGGVGTGYDTINLLTFAPVGRSSLVANYQRA